MFTVAERDSVRERLLSSAGSDPAIVGAAVTGSQAVGGSDRWSDVDLAFAVAGPLGDAMRRWTKLLYDDFAAVHHWDLPSGPAVYRVFLLPGFLEVDLAFTPAADFGPRGPAWQTVFGAAASQPQPAADHHHLAGLAWHHALHAWVCLQRNRWWQAEQWIGALRGQLIALACSRLGLVTGHAKGAHLLPADVVAPLDATLVRTIEEAELYRALTAATAALATELGRTDPALASRLSPLLAELRPGH